MFLGYGELCQVLEFHMMQPANVQVGTVHNKMGEMFLLKQRASSELPGAKIQCLL